MWSGLRICPVRVFLGSELRRIWSIEPGAGAPVSDALGGTILGSEAHSLAHV